VAVTILLLHILHDSATHRHSAEALLLSFAAALHVLGTGELDSESFGSVLVEGLDKVNNDQRV
jgi:hypothetical protein